MHQKDTGIVARSNIQTDVVVVNQCDTDNVQDETYLNNKGEERHIKFISTTERGLSRSRNMAIRNSTADICQIADDDETLDDSYTDIVTEAFQSHPNADVIAFGLSCGRDGHSNYSQKENKINYLSALRVSSVQIAFRRKSIIDNGISFDVQMGAGTRHGAGEENKFLYDCLNKGLHCYYIPKVILRLNSNATSSWFNGYNEEHFLWLGWSSRRYMGRFMATAYAFYTSVTKYKLYKNNCSFLKATLSTLKGIYTPNLVEEGVHRGTALNEECK